MAGDLELTSKSNFKCKAHFVFYYGGQKTIPRELYSIFGALTFKKERSITINKNVEHFISGFSKEDLLRDGRASKRRVRRELRVVNALLHYEELWSRPTFLNWGPGLLPQEGVRVH